MKTAKTYFRGCLLGGACGDAMGYPVELLPWEEIRKVHGDRGITQFPIDKETKEAFFSDDTQMSVFTVDGLLWADKKAKERGIYAYIPCLFYSYQKWLYTQTGHFADREYDFLLEGEILKNEALFARRQPGATSIEALDGCINGKYGTIANRINQSAGAGAVMRAAPIGLYFYNDPKMAFRIGMESGAITHGHSDAFLAAGFLACMIAWLIQGKDLKTAAQRSLKELCQQPDCERICEAVEKAMDLAAQMNRNDRLLDSSEIETVNRIDLSAIGCWHRGSEAVAQGLYCALRYPRDFRRAIQLAVNHDGDSDTVAAICGNILGTYLGMDEIPYPWVRHVECSILLVHGADRLLKAVCTEVGETEEEAYDETEVC